MPKKTQQSQPEQPEVELVHMVRDVPQHRGGPVTADVHPDEVSDYSAQDWRVEKN